LKIFISYRRSDAADVAGRIFDRLQATFGEKNIFKDVDSIPVGANFEEIIAERLSDCEAVIAVIGRTWASVERSDGTRRLHDPADFVRIEIEQALVSRIPLVPALVGNAAMPDPEQLPGSIRKLTRRNAISIRPDPDFHRDMDRLIKALNKYASTYRPKDHNKRPDAMAARRLGDAVALWFLRAGIGNLVMIFSFLPYGLSRLTPQKQSFAALFLGVLPLGVGVPGVAAMCHFLASRSLKNYRDKVMVVTAIVCGFVVGLYFGLVGCFNITAALVMWRLLSVGYLVAAVANFYAAIRGILVLKNASEEFARPPDPTEEPRRVFTQSLLIGLGSGLAALFFLVLVVCLATQR
jgi:hypothetical protein